MTASSPSLRVGGVTRTLWRLSAGLPSGRRLRRGILYRFAAAMCLGVPIGLLVKVIDDLRTDALTSERAWLYTAISVAAVAAQWVFGYLSNRDSWIAGLAVVGELRLRVLDHLRRLPMGFHTRRQTGDAATVFTQDMALIEEFTHEGLPAIAGAIGLPVAVTAVLLFVDAPMALALMASVAASAPLFAWTLRRFASLAATRQGMQAQANSRIIEYVQGIAVIRAFNQSGERQQRFRSSLDDVRQINTRLSVQIAPLNSIFLAVVHLGVPVVIASGAYWLFSGRLDVGVLIVFLVLVLRVYQPLIEVAEQSEILRIADASLQRVAAVLDVPEQPQPAASPPLEHFDVELDDVRFSYEPGVPVLSGVSLTAAERSMTAIIGPRERARRRSST